MTNTITKLLAKTIDDAGCLVWQGGLNHGHPTARINGIQNNEVFIPVVQHINWPAVDNIGENTPLLPINLGFVNAKPVRKAWFVPRVQVFDVGSSQGSDGLVVAPNIICNLDKCVTQTSALDVLNTPLGHSHVGINSIQGLQKRFFAVLAPVPLDVRHDERWLTTDRAIPVLNRLNAVLVRGINNPALGATGGLDGVVSVNDAFAVNVRLGECFPAGEVKDVSHHRFLGQRASTVTNKRLTRPSFRAYTSTTSKEVGIGVPVARRNSRASCRVSGFSFSPSCGGARSPFWRTVWGIRKSAPVLARYANLHGLPPLIGVEGSRFTTLLGATMANSLASTGKSAQRKRLYENLSCITIDADSSEYELKGMSYFDVPLETYSQGCLTGTRLVFEFLKEAVKDDSFDGLQSVLEEAFKALEGDERGHEGTSKRGAAVGLFCTLQEVFNFAAPRLDFTDVFKSTFDYHEADMAEQLKSMRKTNAAILAGLAANPAPILEGASA